MGVLFSYADAAADDAAVRAASSDTLVDAARDAMRLSRQAEARTEAARRIAVRRGPGLSSMARTFVCAVSAA